MTLAESCRRTTAAAVVSCEGRVLGKVVTSRDLPVPVWVSGPDTVVSDEGDIGRGFAR